jgi:hypothetical protein
MNLNTLISLLLLAPFWSLAGIRPLGVVEPEACPADMVDTGAGTCIDEYEWPNQRGAKPLLGISGVQEPWDDADEVMDAERLCASVGKRVCELEEWRSACRGKNDAPYPFGTKLPKIERREDAPCNYAQFYREVNEMKVWERDPKHMAYLDQSWPSGSHESCRSASGAYDMIGNGEEWVRCPGKNEHGWCLVSRYWAHAVTCDDVITGHSPKWHYYTTTVRCCVNKGR